VDKVMGSSNVAEYIGVHQYSVTYPGGVEVPVHAICELHDSNQLHTLISLDWKNAFNSINQVHTACQIAKHTPGLAYLY
jgi:hypothetical protein